MRQYSAAATEYAEYLGAEYAEYTGQIEFGRAA